MGKVWEIRGLFGNEYALEGAAEALKSMKGLEWVVMDRRNLSVRLSRRDEKLEEAVRRTFDIYHGFVESQAPLGEFDAKKAALKVKKMKEVEKKRLEYKKSH
ncbi:MAG TPA: hypothetical protein VEJ36_01285 [Nitrososphaerales archaeon]|nr:hypothetical protein [Nitrososphaerales archaeon]